MLRLLSLLLLIVGIGAAWIGGKTFMENSEREMRMAQAEVMTESAPPPVTDEAVDAEIAEVEVAEEAYEEAVTDAPVTGATVPDAEAVTDDAPMAAETEDKAPRARSLQSVTPESQAFGRAEDPTFQPQIAEAEAMEEAMAPEEVVTGAVVVPEPVEGDEAGAAVAAEPIRSASQAFIDTLKTVPVAHETPGSAEYKRAFNVTLAIDATDEGDGTATDALPGGGNVVEGTARVSDRVEVRLTGADFDIIGLSPEVQSLSPVTENTWRWSVTPLAAGSHDLVFEIFAIDQDSVVPLRTFSDKVTVQVSGINKAIAFADQANPLFVLLGGIGSALGGLFGVLKFFGGKR